MENRSVPPLLHNWVTKLAGKFPNLTFELNGEVKSLKQVENILDKKRKSSSTSPNNPSSEDAHRPPAHPLSVFEQKIPPCQKESKYTDNPNNQNSPENMVACMIGR